MRKVEAIVRAHVLEKVTGKLKDIGIEGLTVTPVRGCGNDVGHTPLYKPNSILYHTLTHRAKIEVVVPDELVEKAIQAIIRGSRTGQVGDGKIFVTPVEQAYRIRTEESGEAAITGKPVVGIK